MKGAEIELPPGFRFHPTDDELVNHYLCKKCAGLGISVPIIAEIDLYKFDPWDLPEMAMYGEKEWYFFSPRNRKYPNGSRPNRAAGTGYWKATGADKPIGRPKPVAIKKALVFYAGKAPRGIKTNWIMHEYRLANVDRSARNKTNLRLDDWVLCRIYNKKGRIETNYPALPIDKKTIKYPEMDEEEDQKPTPTAIFMSSGQYGTTIMPQQHQSPAAAAAAVVPSVISNDILHTDMSDSMPRLHTDSSCSEHVLSPCDQKEVQSEHKWNDFDIRGINGSGFGFSFMNDMDGFEDDPFGAQLQFQMDQLSPLQDSFLFNYQ